MRILLGVLILLAAGPRRASAQSDSAAARCAAVVARVLADTSLHPTASGPTVIPIVQGHWPKDAREQPISVRFRMGPDGRAELATVEVVGTKDEKYRRRLTGVLERTQFGIGQFEDCPAPRWLTWTLTHTKR